MSDTPPARITLADLIDQHRMGALAVAEAQTRLAQTDAVLIRALEVAAATVGPVLHAGQLWRIDTLGRVDGRDWPHPSSLPNARDLEVPAECLRDQAKGKADRS